MKQWIGLIGLGCLLLAGCCHNEPLQTKAGLYITELDVDQVKAPATDAQGILDRFLGQIGETSGERVIDTSRLLLLPDGHYKLTLARQSVEGTWRWNNDELVLVPDSFAGKSKPLRRRMVFSVRSDGSQLVATQSHPMLSQLVFVRAFESIAKA